MESYYQLAKSVAINLLRGSTALTKELIVAKVSLAISLDPQWNAHVDADALVRDLETQFSVWIGHPKTLDDLTDHVPWLEQKRGSISWSYWGRYRELLKETWPPRSLERLHEVTDELLMRLEDPARPGSWDRRGLVVGHVQSGKTANYIGLINKAVDAGYRLIVVLAGLHKSLRSQTQIRLDEGFLGYESVAAVAANQGAKAIGVGRIWPALRPNTITNRSDGGDFKRAVAEHFQINPGDKPLLFVIKKNASVLKNLLEWVEWAAGERVDGKFLIRDVPLLVVDDEADNASVDTKDHALDENGALDPEHDPTVINSRIRRLLHCFQKAAYVGYTATPFANIFIHEQGHTTNEGEDLFPKSFIVSLPAPSDYMGPLRVFGRSPDPGEDFPTAIGLPIVRVIDDHATPEELEGGSGWMPLKHNKAHHPLTEGTPELTPSLQEAILAFVLATAARRLRGQVSVHNSMLIHVTRYTAVQELVYGQVKGFMTQVQDRLKWGEGEAAPSILERLRALWERDFIPTSTEIGETSHSWSDVAPGLWNAASAIGVMRINGTAPDILDYETHKKTGLSVIAIGGDKLARGLTLEGLTVSYFLRATKMYDTLMQMGRWFGYRPGYLDLCRLYMTEELGEWFEHITSANEELREEFDRMAASGGSPRDYGLKVKSHPSLLITAGVKMRNGRDLDLSFAGAISETTVFPTDARSLATNLNAVLRLITLLGADAGREPHQNRPDNRRDEWKGSLMWSDVPAAQVVSFLRGVVTHALALKVQAKLMADYIELAVSAGETTDWTVALIGKKDGRRYQLGPLEVSLIHRSGRVHGTPPRFTIQRLLSPRDEAIDLDAAAWARALQSTREAWTADPARSPGQETPTVPNGPAIRQVRSPANALLLLYMLDNIDVGRKDENREAREQLNLGSPLVGLAVSFPSAVAQRTVKYRVNNVYWQQEYGTST